MKMPVMSLFLLTYFSLSSQVVDFEEVQGHLELTNVTNQNCVVLLEKSSEKDVWSPIFRRTMEPNNTISVELETFQYSRIRVLAASQENINCSDVPTYYQLSNIQHDQNVKERKKENYFEISYDKNSRELHFLLRNDDVWKEISSCERIGKLNIYAIDGRLVYSQDIDRTHLTNQHTFILPIITAGLYISKVDFCEELELHKFIIR